MQLQITDFGVGVLNAAGGPVALEGFKLGTAYNYVALTNEPDIRGSMVFAGEVSPALAVNANVVKYSCYLDYDIGDFNFGEVGFYYQGSLFAIGVDSKLISKIRNGLSEGNSIRIDAFLTFVGANYGMWVDVAETKNEFRMASLHSPDQLPPSSEAVPNAYIISGADSTQAAFIAYTDRNGLWTFDAYQFATANTATIVSFDNKSVTINVADLLPSMVPSYFGEVILQFATGDIYSTCRYVKTTVTSGSVVTLGFDTTLAMLPSAGDKVTIYRRAMGAPSLPIATRTTVGVVKIGSGISVDPDGTISLDGSASVISVNGKTGVVVLTADDISGISKVGKTGDYNDLLNKPDLTLPTMSTSVKGGAKLPGNGNLVVSGDVLDLGFAPIKTIDGKSPDASGNFDIFSSVIGLVNPKAIPASADLNSYSTTGLFTVSASVAPTLTNSPITSGSFALEVVPIDTATNVSVQRASNGVTTYWRKKTGASTWSAWVMVATNAVATTTSLGVVQIGAGLNINGAGVLTPKFATVAEAGVVQVGTGLVVDGSGLLSVEFPIATNTAPGIMQVGTGLAVDANGVVSVDTANLPIASSSTLGVIKVGAGLNVTLGGTLSVNPSTLPVATTSTLGVVKAGPGITVAPDGTISVSTSTLPIASASALGVIKVGQGLNISPSGVLSTNIKTINGQLPDPSGNIVVTAASDTNKLDKVNGVAVGIQLQFSNLGSKVGGDNVTISTNAANVNAVTFTGGAGNVTWIFANWPSSGIYAEVQMEVINGGLATHIFPAQVKFIKPDGTTTTSLATCISSQRSGATNLQSAGTDFLVFWTRDGGATVWCKIL